MILDQFKMRIYQGTLKRQRHVLITSRYTKIDEEFKHRSRKCIAQGGYYVPAL